MIIIIIINKTNIKKNFDRKENRYKQLLSDLSKRYRVYYVNLSLGAIGVIGNDSLIVSKLKTFDLSVETVNFIIKRTINVCIRTTYYIFCMRNKQWESPELLNWWNLMQTSRWYARNGEYHHKREDENSVIIINYYWLQI